MPTPHQLSLDVAPIARPLRPDDVPFLAASPFVDLTSPAFRLYRTAADGARVTFSTLRDHQIPLVHGRASTPDYPGHPGHPVTCMRRCCAEVA